MQNHFQKKSPLMPRRMIPLAHSELEPIAAPGYQSFQLANWQKPLEVPIRAAPQVNVVEEKPQYSGFKLPTVPKSSAPKRFIAVKVDPDYNPRISKLNIAKKIMQTRGQVKKDQVNKDHVKKDQVNKDQVKKDQLNKDQVKKDQVKKYQGNKLTTLLNVTSTRSVLKNQKQEQPKVSSVKLVPSGSGKVSTVWHSGNVCQHSLAQICSPETRETAASDVERWRSIESICLHLRGIDVTGDVGILKGPVSFEDVFQVLGLDEQGESLARPPSPDVQVVDSPSPDVQVVDSPAPDVQVVDSPTPDVQVVDSPTPDVQVVDSPMPDFKMVDSPTPDVKVVDSPIPDVKVVDSPIPDVKVDSPEMEMSVVSPFKGFDDIEIYSPLPLPTIHRPRSRVRSNKVRGIKPESKSISKSPRRSNRNKRLIKDAYRRR